MPKKKAKRSDRVQQLDALEKKDPALHLAMMELRRSNPQAYRKQLKRLAQGKRRPSTTTLRKWGKSERKKAKALAKGKAIDDPSDEWTWNEVPRAKVSDTQD